MQVEPNHSDAPKEQFFEVSVVVPAYRKVGQIGPALEGIHQALSDQQLSHEIIVVVDGSPDGTGQEADSLGLPCIRIESNEVNRGKGYAIRQGARSATGQLVAFADADPDIHSEGICHLINQLHDANADLVVGSKAHESSVLVYPWPRRLQSLVYRRLVKSLFGLGIRDTQTGLKVMRRDVIDRVLDRCQIDGYAFDLEFLVMANDEGFLIKEGPVRIDFAFSSTVPITAAWRMLLDTKRIQKHRYQIRD